MKGAVQARINFIVRKIRAGSDNLIFFETRVTEYRTGEAPSRARPAGALARGNESDPYFLPDLAVSVLINVSAWGFFTLPWIRMSTGETGLP